MNDAQRLKQVRTQLDIGQSKMAELMGYTSYDMITKIETGRRKLSGPANKLLKRIAKDNGIEHNHFSR